jgi:hypothetical protein
VAELSPLELRYQWSVKLLRVALAAGWWADSRSYRYGFRYEQTVTTLDQTIISLEIRLKAEDYQIGALKANNAKLLRAIDRLQHESQGRLRLSTVATAMSISTPTVPPMIERRKIRRPLAPQNT